MDGVADAYAKADAWVLRYRDGEVDDSRARVDTSNNLNSFQNGESVANQDLVFWYAAHFLHETHDGKDVNALVGPDLKPYRW